MKTLTLLRNTAIAATILATSISAIAANELTKQYTLPSFDKVSVGGNSKVLISQANTQSVSISTDTDTLKKLQVSVDDDTLIIRNKPSGMFGFGKTTKVLVNIQVPELESIEMGGKSQLNVSPFTVDKLKITLAGDSTGNITGKFEKLAINTAGDNTVTLSGEADNLYINSAGDSNVDASELQAQKAIINGVGDSNLTLRVAKYLRVKSAGSNTIKYYGSPEINKSSVGNSSITQIN